MSVKKIKDIMHDEVYSVNYRATIKEVLELMVDKEISGVLVVDDDNYVVGFISDGDIMKFIAKQDPRIIDMTSFITVWYDTESFEKKLDDLMNLNVMELATTKVISVDEDFEIDEVAKILGKKKIKKVPVLRDGRLVGVVSRAHIIRYIVSTRFLK